MKKTIQLWTVRLFWQAGGSNYERGRTNGWPPGTTAMQVLRDAASDPSNGCDLDTCTRIEVCQGDEIEVNDP